MTVGVEALAANRFFFRERKIRLKRLGFDDGEELFAEGMVVTVKE